MGIFRHSALFVGLACLGFAATLLTADPPQQASDRRELSPPVAVTLPGADGATAEVVACDADRVRLRMPDGTMRTRRWEQLRPDDVLQVHRQLLAPEDGEAWLALGERLLAMPEGDAAAETAFKHVLALDTAHEDRVRAILARHRREQAQAWQRRALTEQVCELPEPVEVDVRLREDQRRLEGELLQFDHQHVWIGGPDDTPRQVAWRDMEVASITDLLARVIEQDNAMGWFRAGRLLLSLPGGDDAARRAFTHAVDVNPDLRELVRVAYRHDRARPDDAVQTTDSAPEAEVELVTGFEASLRHPVKRLGPAHFEVTLPDGRDTNGFFLFRLEGVGAGDGQSVQIDFRNAPSKWDTLNHVYSYADRLDDPAEFQARPPQGVKRSASGVLLPADGAVDGEANGGAGTAPGWRYIATVWREGDRLSLLHRFDAAEPGSRGDVVHIAMRPPYTPGLCDAYMQELLDQRDELLHNRQVPVFEVHEVGKTAAGRSMWVVQVAEGQEREVKNKPTVVIYAREHGDEHDTSWLVQGAIDFLTSDHRLARQARRRTNFLLIPLLDPDCAADNIYERIIFSFRASEPTPESLAWAEFFQGWVNDGYRLDLTLNIHNVESAESNEHFFPPQIEPAKGGRAAAANVLNGGIARLLEMHDYSARGTCRRHGISNYRLGGFLSTAFGTLHQPYELNSQAKARHINLYELKLTGPLVALAAAEFCSSAVARRLMANIDARREKRAALWQRYGVLPRVAEGDVFFTEDYIKVLPQVEQQWRDMGRVPEFLEPLYETQGDAIPRELLDRETRR